MKHLSRRSFVSSLSGALAGTALWRATRRAHAGTAPRRSPRYLVHVFLSGGIDGIWTTDPKHRKQVASGIDVPYRSKDIIEVTPQLRLGPHLKPLERHAKDMAIVNGITVGTANHQTGTLQALRLRTGASIRMPALAAIAGSIRSGQPIGAVSLGQLMTRDYDRDMFGTSTSASHDLFRLAENVAPSDLQVLADALRTKASNLSRSEARTAQKARDIASFFGQVAEAKKIEYAQWSDDPKATQQAKDLQRALWLIRNDLTKAIYIHVGFNAWDSHRFNTSWQDELSGQYMPVLARFLDELKTTKNEHGSLFDQTLIVLGSDLGRFPRLNQDNGKDHFPEIGMMLLGAGLSTGSGRGATFGVTGRQMEGLSVSASSGQPTGKPSDRRLKLDDVGATVLSMMGIRSPEQVGYHGQILEFLMA